MTLLNLFLNPFAGDINGVAIGFWLVTIGLCVQAWREAR